MALKRCLTPGCPGHNHYRGYCAPCAQQRNRTTHNRERKRVYNSKRWRTTRRSKLFVDPLCERCGRLATEVHHRKDLAAGGDPYAAANLESLCAGCHGRVTRKRQA